MTDGPWTDEENDLIVADYFAMLADDLSGRRYVKAEHNRALQGRIARSKGSIEFKHANISALMPAFGQPILTGNLPRYNVQMALAEAVDRWLRANPEWVERLPKAATPGMAYTNDRLFIETPPTMRNTPPPEEAEQMRTIARHFDVAAQQERNRALGRLGEERALAHERATLRDAGRDDLARKVIWVSQEIGDGAGYDISSFTPDGTPRLLEVKTTNGWDRTPFHISQNELHVAEENRDTWHLFRIYNNARGPRAFELRPPLDHHVTLTPTSFQARFD
ncbi:DUF3883 domain-containing protein [Pseudooceanicola nitratireducens]|uniref:DUF3883 domain-containing protein n=1 Tax=Pseudooceanicola nitratireducens TaxID=517719 RepID=UPI001C9696BA|nr:DUF3883 domain-containing protein [Pseudooceanicola nitratireducens]MBY6166742.1 DUF3883 domain-containing protein [Pseudooceanicola nitratireducens]